MNLTVLKEYLEISKNPTIKGLIEYNELLNNQWETIVENDKKISQLQNIK